MKFVGIAGSSSYKSYNKKLLDFAKYITTDTLDIEILDISGLPIFNKDYNIANYPRLKELEGKILDSDGVIIATPEINHTVPAMLKSFIEWLSYTIHPFKDKPVMIIGTSHAEQGTARAQAHLRQILASPGVEAYVMPGNEYLLTNAKEKFDEDGRLIDEKSADYLEHCLLRFSKYAKLLSQLDLDSVESKFTMTMKAGGYVNLDDPDADGTAGASEY